MTSLVVGGLVAVAVLLVPVGPARRLLDLAAVSRDGAGGSPSDDVPVPRTRAPSTDVAAVATQLAALTRGGLAPAAAWEAVGHGLAGDAAGRVLADAARAGARGLPVAHLLVPVDRAARRPVGSARDQLAVLAATTGIHERTGAPLADLLERAAAGLRQDADAALARRTALAAPSATARVLVALPPVGLLLGLLVGGDPVRVLVADPVGRGCAIAGAVCAAAGWAWSRALVRRAVQA